MYSSPVFYTILYHLRLDCQRRGHQLLRAPSHYQAAALSPGSTCTVAPVNSVFLVGFLRWWWWWWCQHCLQVYQAFRISVAGQCKVQKGTFLFFCCCVSYQYHALTALVPLQRGCPTCMWWRCHGSGRIPSPRPGELYLLWFFFSSSLAESCISLTHSLTHSLWVCPPSMPSLTEISGMLHTSRPDNSSDVLLQLHTAPNCMYKVKAQLKKHSFHIFVAKNKENKEKKKESKNEIQTNKAAAIYWQWFSR